MLRLDIVASVLFLASLPACEEVGPDADCFERRTDEEFGNVSVVNTCSVDALCDGLELLCPGNDEEVDCGPDEASVDNPEALACMLEALAEGRSGRLSWSTTPAGNRGWAARGHRLWARGSKAYYAGSSSVDLDVDVDGVRYVQLRSRSQFAECRDEDTDAKRLKCVMDPWTEVLGVVLSPGGG